MLPWEIWATFPIRHIQRFYYHAMRDKWRDRYFRMRLEDPKLKEPDWLYEDPDKKSRAKTSNADFDRMKAAWARLKASPRQGNVTTEVPL